MDKVTIINLIILGIFLAAGKTIDIIGLYANYNPAKGKQILGRIMSGCAEISLFLIIICVLISI